MNDRPCVVYRCFEDGDALARDMEAMIDKYIVTNCYFAVRAPMFHVWYVVREIPLQ